MHIKLKVNGTDGKTVQTVNFTTNDGKYSVIQQPQGAVTFELLDESTGVAPQVIVAKRVGNNLEIAFEDDQAVELIIENYYTTNDKLSPVIGLAENGKYYAYIPENGVELDAIPALKEGVFASEVLGGEHLVALPVTTGFHLPYWGYIAGGVLAAGLAVGLASGGGGGNGAGNGTGTNNTNTNANPPTTSPTDTNTDGESTGNNTGGETPPTTQPTPPTDTTPPPSTGGESTDGESTDPKPEGNSGNNETETPPSTETTPPAVDEPKTEENSGNNETETPPSTETTPPAVDEPKTEENSGNSEKEEPAKPTDETPPSTDGDSTDTTPSTDGDSTDANTDGGSTSEKPEEKPDENAVPPTQRGATAEADPGRPSNQAILTKDLADLKDDNGQPLVIEKLDNPFSDKEPLFLLPNSKAIYNGHPVIYLDKKGNYFIEGRTFEGTTFTLNDKDGNPVTGEDGNPITVTAGENGFFNVPLSDAAIAKVFGQTLDEDGYLPNEFKPENEIINYSLRNKEGVEEKFVIDPPPAGEVENHSSPIFENEKGGIPMETATGETIYVGKVGDYYYKTASSLDEDGSHEPGYGEVHERPDGDQFKVYKQNDEGKLEEVSPGSEPFSTLLTFTDIHPTDDGKIQFTTALADNGSIAKDGYLMFTGNVLGPYLDKTLTYRIPVTIEANNDGKYTVTAEMKGHFIVGEEYKDVEVDFPVTYIKSESDYTVISKDNLGNIGVSRLVKTEASNGYPEGVLPPEARYLYEHEDSASATDDGVVTPTLTIHQPTIGQDGVTEYSTATPHGASASKTVALTIQPLLAQSDEPLLFKQSEVQTLDLGNNGKQITAEGNWVDADGEWAKVGTQTVDEVIYDRYHFSNAQGVEKDILVQSGIEVI